MDENVYRPQGRPALITAARVGDEELVRELLDGGADIDIQDEEGITALSIAIMEEKMHVVSLLLDRGANPNIGDREGWTPLMHSIYIEESLVSLLLDKGADPDIRNIIGMTVLMHSVLMYDISSIHLLLRAGARTSIKDIDGRVALDFLDTDIRSIEGYMSLTDDEVDRITSIFNSYGRSLYQENDRSRVYMPVVFGDLRVYFTT
jgi:ankyrin repeat protein